MDNEKKYNKLAGKIKKAYLNAQTNSTKAVLERDLLFKKMHEMGYEWDTEKKEQKKIEQESGAEDILNKLSDRIENAEIVNVRQVLEWIEEQTKK